MRSNHQPRNFDIFSYDHSGSDDQAIYFSINDNDVEENINIGRATAQMVVTENGNVGIGTTEPGAKLDVDGSINVSGALHANDMHLHDIAEPFEMTDIEDIEQGDVVIIDPDNPRHLKKSTEPFDGKVAGVISSLDQAGYVVGRRADGTNDKPLALAGRVLAKVSGENGPIEIGDLMTTSSTPGHLMRYSDVEISDARDKRELMALLGEDRNRRKAVVGKALEGFGAGCGEIMVLLD